MPTEQMEAQRQAIKQVVRTGTMGDGSPVEETYDYWNRLAEIWDDLYPEDLNPSATVLSLVPETDEPLRVVDVGCGTGKAWETVFERATNARITGIELCQDNAEIPYGTGGPSGDNYIISLINNELC